MGLFQTSVHSLFAMICILYFLHLLLLSIDANQPSQEPQQQKRIRRSWISIFSDKNDNKQYHTGDHSPMIQTGVEGPTVPPKDISQVLGQQTNRIIEGATDVVLTPVTWLSYIQKYWPLYLICATIIFGLITFFYCSCQHKIGHLLSNKNNKTNYEPMALVNFLREQQPLRNLPFTK